MTEQFQKCLKTDCFRKVHVGTLYCCGPCATAGEMQCEIERHSADCDRRATERGEYSVWEADIYEQRNVR
jgi:hypothetical protein